MVSIVQTQLEPRANKPYLPFAPDHVDDDIVDANAGAR